MNVSFLKLNTSYFISNTFIRNTRLKLAKNRTKARQHPEAELLLFENYSLSLSILASKVNVRYSKKFVKNKCVCLNKIMWLIIMKMRLKMKNGSHRYDVNRTRPRNRHKYSKHKMFFSMIMVMCNRQRLSSIWSWI